MSLLCVGCVAPALFPGLRSPSPLTREPTSQPARALAGFHRQTRSPPSPPLTATLVLELVSPLALWLGESSPQGQGPPWICSSRTVHFLRTHPLWLMLCPSPAVGWLACRMRPCAGVRPFLGLPAPLPVPWGTYAQVHLNAGEVLVLLGPR